MKTIHPDYWNKPIWELINQYGHDWLSEQDKIFMQIIEDPETN